MTIQTKWPSFKSRVREGAQPSLWGRCRVIQKRVLYPEMETQALMPQSRMLSRLQCCSLDNKASNLFQTRIGWYSCLTLDMLSFSDFLETLPNQCGVASIREERGLSSPSCKQIRGAVESKRKTVCISAGRQGHRGCGITGKAKSMGTTSAILWNFQDGAQKAFTD